ncbi:hypothetical protein [Infirmifilum sp. SLHALR2]|nr:MAG: hypothetical protein B7L53_06775 [Thermofilum sp. NZ13]
MNRVARSRVLFAATVVVLLALAVSLLAGSFVKAPLASSYREAEEVARSITGYASLDYVQIGTIELRPDYAPLDPSSLQLSPPDGLAARFAVADKRTGAVYVLFSDSNLTRRVLAVLHRGDVRFIELKLRKVDEREFQGSTYTQEVTTDKGTERMVGISKCRAIYYESYTDEPAKLDVVVPQFTTAYVDCHYTTQIGGANLVTTHAAAWIDYIPNSTILAVNDVSYDQIQAPVVSKCWFSSRSSVASTSASVRAEGKYLICYYGIRFSPSTQWTQFSQFVFWVNGQVSCSGSHSAWVALTCDC